MMVLVTHTIALEHLTIPVIVVAIEISMIIAIHVKMAL